MRECIIKAGSVHDELVQDESNKTVLVDYKLRLNAMCPFKMKT